MELESFLIGLLLGVLLPFIVPSIPGIINRFFGKTKNESET